jgi:hypothetical protein
VPSLFDRFERHHHECAYCGAVVNAQPNRSSICDSAVLSRAKWLGGEQRQFDRLRHSADFTIGHNG